MHDSYKTKFKELIDIHNEFARAVKLVEHIDFEVDYTSLNDARYALRAVVDCLQEVTQDNPDEQAFNDKFATARLALNIAWHDIVDIAHQEFKLHLDYLAGKYGPDLVAGIIDVNSCKTIIYKVEDCVRQTREHRDERTEIYRQITSDDMEEILRLYRLANDAEPALAAKKKKERIHNFFTYIAPVLVIISILVGLHLSNGTSSNNIPENTSSQSTSKEH